MDIYDKYMHEIEELLKDVKLTNIAKQNILLFKIAQYLEQISKR